MSEKSSGLPSWLLPVCTCISCGGALSISESSELTEDRTQTGLLSCDPCDRSWPILAGIPMMLEDPSTYLAQYRESVLASLAEVNAASPEALALIDWFIGDVRSEAMRYGDDWTSAEAASVDDGELDSPVESNAALDAYAKLVQCNEEDGGHQTVLKMLGERLQGFVIEVGPGAGEVSKSLAASCKNLLLLDFSLRSLLLAQAKARTENAAEVASILCDVSLFDMASECADAIVAVNVVDIIEEPESFLRSASRWLKADCPFVLTTPDPSLGSGYEPMLLETLDLLEYTLETVQDGIPWLREHSARHCQLYWLQAICVSI